MRFFSSFLCPHRALRALHSFPTRRSSDLVMAGEVGVDAAGGDCACLLLRCAGALQQRRADARETVGLDDRQDRKSTRLNSSHLVISYAVFCLKKKNKLKQPNTQAKHYRET